MAQFIPPENGCTPYFPARDGEDAHQYTSLFLNGNLSLTVHVPINTDQLTGLVLLRAKTLTGEQAKAVRDAADARLDEIAEAVALTDDAEPEVAP